MAIGSLILNSEACAQDNPNKNNTQNYWAIIGFGGSSVGWVANGANLSYQTGKHIISIRGILAIGSQYGDYYVWDVGALYGRCFKGQSTFISMSGGIGMVRGINVITIYDNWIRVGQRRTEWFTTIGIPVETQLYWTPISFLGIGLYGFANLNTEESFIGALASIQIGKLR